MTSPDWNSEKVKKIQTLFEKFITQKTSPNSHSSKAKLRIYVTRKLAVKRHLSNEEEFLPLLKKHNFRKFYLEELNNMDQVQLFRTASHVIAAHGAGLTNVLFAPAEIKILEIRPLLSSGQFCFENLFSLGWPNCEFLVPPKSGNFFLPLDSLEEVLLRWQNEI